MSKVKIQGNASGTGIFTVAAPATNTDRTITLPDVDATVLTTAGGTINGQLVVNQNNSGGVAAISLPQDESTIQGPAANTAIRMGSNLVLRAAVQTSIDTGGTARVVVDSSGRITLPYQPAFHAYPGSTVSVSSGNNKFTFNSTRFNIGNHYSTSTGRFTAPVTGVYLFTFQAYYYPGTTSDSYQGIQLYVNGSGVYAGYARGGYGDTTWGNSVHLRMNANDYLEFYTYPASSTNLNTMGSYLTGHLVG
jgi:hypothetical protein